MIENFYAGTSILITGGTGFLGKVLLEKLLYSLPEISRIYVFIRPKKGLSLFERFQKEILDSPCFDRLKSLYPNFDSFIIPKLCPIKGDMTKPNLDISESDYDELTQSLNIIINSAASVNFNQRLDQALQINTLGTLRVFELAKQCPKLKSFVQISTAYVNSDKEGWIQEKIYPFNGNPCEVLKELASIPAEDIEKQTPKLLGKFANTYTFTKNLTEQILLREASGVPICIVRPTVVGGSWKEPYPGWVDNVSAAAGFYISTGVGLIKMLVAKPELIGDQIPVDSVINCVILAGALLCNKEKIEVVHIGTSVRNPYNWQKSYNTVNWYWKNYPSKKEGLKGDAYFITSAMKFKLAQFTNRTIPWAIIHSLGKITGLPVFTKNSVKLAKLSKREIMINEMNMYFSTREWVFESQNVVNMMKMLTPRELSIFDIDVTKLDWKTYLVNLLQGLKKYKLNEEIEPLNGYQSLDLISEFGYFKRFSDIKWMFSSGSFSKNRNLADLKSLVINSPRVNKAINEIIERNPEFTQKKAHGKALEIVNTMVSDFNAPVIKLFAWFLRKLWKNIYKMILINHSEVQELAKFIKSNNGPVVVLPSNRSYIDYLIISYVFFSYDIPLPNVAVSDDFLKIVLMNKLFRLSGAFFIKQDSSDDKLYTAILTEYIQLLLKDNKIVEFFIEGSRSRSGKISAPKLNILSMCTDLYYQRGVSDIHFVPITINYDRVLEGETFPLELLGKEKVKESLTRIIKSVKVLRTNFGKIHIELGQVFSLKKFSEMNGFDPVEFPEHRFLVNSKLAQEVVLRFQEQLAITPSTLMSAILMAHRKGMSKKELIKQVEWLRDEVAYRGIKTVGIDTGSASNTVKNTLGYLSPFINYKIDLSEPSISIGNDYQKILMLSYYRNSLYFIFAVESLIAISLFKFSENFSLEQGVLVDKLLEEVSFLAELFEGENLLRDSIRNPDVKIRAIELMKKRGFIQENEGKIKIDKIGIAAISFLCSLAWPVLDTYWIVLSFCKGNRYGNQYNTKVLADTIQWFALKSFKENSIRYFESCSLENVKNAINQFKKMKVLEKSNKAVVFCDEYLRDETKCDELLEHINSFRKPSTVKMVNQADNLKKGLLTEFPSTPKI